MAKLSAPETARMFLRHLVDNVGQFQQLYDGLFRWKMNDDPALPTFNAIRPYFVHLLVSADINSRAGVTILDTAVSESVTPISDNIAGGGLFEETNPMNATGYSGFQGTPSPFDTASEAGFDCEIDDSIYNAIYSPDLYKNDSVKSADKEDDMESVSVCNEPENPSPPPQQSEPSFRSIPHSPWSPSPQPQSIQKPTVNAEMEDDFDFEGNLSAFEKIPLCGQAAIKAASNASKQESAIAGLFRRAKTKKQEHQNGN